MDKREISLGKKFSGVSMHETHHYTEIENEIEDFLDIQSLLKELRDRFISSNKTDRENILQELWFVPIVEDFRFPLGTIENWFFVKHCLDNAEKLRFEIYLITREEILSMYSNSPKNLIALSKPSYDEASRDGKVV